MEVKARRSQRELRRIFKERPALKSARELLLKIEEVADWSNCEDWALDENEKCRLLRPAVFWEYAAIAGEDRASFENRLRACMETFQAILAAIPKEQSQAGPDAPLLDSGDP
ncbi:hypothetical protein EI171_22465 [Bradyrhizobium sp. LCT2]|uniref:hypothetical protein n=1 Tax=Bradyrhizobium sp. LCT2 TaxID=2493093 RepID=UPI0013744578|nr:hypothetical protein [Bradyrhizobium sp. LCT2]QHP69815.1 hypothetical protein EI171_22465 [Bradyrhizobium sp. LCT2]